ncbi:type IV fimbrial biogenesis protein FimT [Noviherbaspirillum humi]|uniref:Type II secretion system protein H n=1 Tax=Noviherbaspirillum humi TaxID=1688639 RepID=A0A239DLQ2_9BURK|nr:GspH/FimT family pseudopilin [Noviherbaspirillum humi]SNS33001.1 type IV fimbrial biogenesis protein FimT [Noviherbaspirillum humi]
MSSPLMPSRRGFASPEEQGFTLVEMVVTVALAGTLAAMAAPSFSGFVAGQRAKNAATEIYSSLARTRSEAITRGGDVTLAPKNGAWVNGWQITDANSKASSKVLDDKSAFSGLTIAGPTSVVYRSSGRLQSGSAPMFVVQSGTGSGNGNQCVSADPSGRPYIKAGTTC